MDAAPGGMCDWLCEVAVAENPRLEQLRGARGKLFHSSVPIEPNPNPPAGFEGAGMGRLVTLCEPRPLRGLKDRFLHNLRCNTLSLAVPQTKKIDDIRIRTIAACPGSGASLLMRNGVPIADLLITGEMSHHDALATIEHGSCVMAVFHSNSERGFVQGELLRRLNAELATVWPSWRKSVLESQTWPKEAIGGEEFEVVHSTVDHDPYNVFMGN
ncbi:hypothetical protein KEM55_006543 [Ascosphaera atra]|nr:hypothetical protein KEM55_006543 [Ascosphaera atra]